METKIHQKFDYARAARDFDAGKESFLSAGPVTLEDFEQIGIRLELGRASRSGYYCSF